MAKTPSSIKEAVDAIIRSMNLPPAQFDPNATAYLLIPNHPEDFSFIALFRYGNWAGGGFGGRMYAPPLEWESTSLTASQLEARIRTYRREDPATGIYDGLDAHGRIHDLLYEKANIDAAQAYLAFLKNNPNASAAAKATEIARLSDQQNNGYLEADVWWMETRDDPQFQPASPLGLIANNIATVYFGLRSDWYLLQEGQFSVPVDTVVHDLGTALGSHLGNLIAGDDTFAPIVGNVVGGAVGAGIGELLLNGDWSQSLLTAFDSGETLLEASINASLAQFGVSLSGVTSESLSNFAGTLIAEAAEDLGLGDFGTNVITTVGQDVSDFLIDTFIDYVSGDGTAIIDAIFDGLKMVDIEDYFVDIAIEYISTEFVSELLDFAKSLVSIDSKGEALFAQIQSIAGSVIGNYLLPYFGGKIGEALGHILGSIIFETFDFLTGGLLSDWFNDDPVGAYYTKFDLATGHMVIDHPNSDHTWDANGYDDLAKLQKASKAMTDAYLLFINGVIDSVGGEVSLENFDDTHGPGRLNHAAFGYHSGAFQLMEERSGDKTHSQDPNLLVRIGIEWELGKLIFRGGDLAQSRALQVWQAQRAEGLADRTLKAGDSLGFLTSDLQIARDYRNYLENAETINFLIAAAPNTSFSLGWMATLAQAAALGLNAPYTDTADGAVGTSGDNTILSADGDDILYGNAGNDVLKAYGGADLLYGGPGDDLLSGGEGRDLLLGDDGDDRASGGGGDDQLLGLTGDDRLEGDLGDDQLGGEDGDDTLVGGDGSDVLYGGTGLDTLSGGRGTDYIRGGQGNDDAAGGTDADQLFGEDGDDLLQGDQGEDRITGGAGSDRLSGGADADRIFGDDGADTLFGETGDDILLGMAGDDTVNGDEGADQVFGDDGNDSLFGGAGDDVMGGWRGRDRLIGGAGNDVLAGEDANDTIDGGAGDDVLHGDRLPTAAPSAHSEAEIIAATEARIGASSFAVIYQGQDYALETLAAAPHELLVIHSGKSLDASGATIEEVPWTTAELASLQSVGKILVGYLNLAKINDFTDMWSAGWTTGGRAKDSLTSGAPAWLGDLDPGNAQTRLVDFWKAGWREALYQRMDAVIGQGFNGIFLDDALEYFVRNGSTPSQIAFAARAMRDLVIDLRAHAEETLTNLGRSQEAIDDFLFIINGAPFIIQDGIADGSPEDSAKSSEFYAAIDAFLAENYFSLDAGYAVDAAVENFGSRGIALLSLESNRSTEQARIAAMMEAVDAGFMPYATASGDYSVLNTAFVSGYGDTIAPGDDVLRGGEGKDTLFGDAGNDQLIGGAGDDSLTGGSGKDTFVFTPGCGADLVIDFRRGQDVIDVSAFGTIVSITQDGGSARLWFATGDSVKLNGLQANTLRPADFVGLAAPLPSLPAPGYDRTVEGTASANSLAGDARHERLLGLTGNDTLQGFAGNDRIEGGDGGDKLLGGDGDDVLVGGAGQDTLTGGAGEDTFVFAPGDGGNTVTDFEQGADKLDISAYGDYLSLVQLATGAKVVFSDGAYVVLNGIQTTSLTSADFVGLAPPPPPPPGPPAIGSERTLTGTIGANTLTGDERYETLLGLGGNDTLSGIGGQDRLEGGDGNDKLSGGDGDDVLVGGAGQDTLTGGAGRDLFVIGLGDGANTITDFQDGLDLISFGAFGGYSSIIQMAGGARVMFADGSYVILSGVQATTLSSADFTVATSPPPPPPPPAGFERVLSGALGADTLNGDSRWETIRGLDGNDTLNGLGGSDRLEGGLAADKLNGGDGDDVLIGGGGQDTLTGGAGADIFVLAPGDGPNTITDFQDGIDRIDVSAYGGYASLVQLASGAKVIFADGAYVTLTGIQASSLSAADFIGLVSPMLSDPSKGEWLI